jgi:large subunit ribosomal protein L24
MCKVKIKKNDSVIVISGKYRNYEGTVLSVDRKNSKVVVSGVSVVSKVVRSKNGVERVRSEMPISISNVLLKDPITGLPTRVGFKFNENGEKMRYAKKSGTLIDCVK